MTTDELGACTGEEIRYVWLDEDDRECSPLHEKFGTALRFGEQYAYRAARREKARRENRERWGDDYQTEPSTINYPFPDSKTGKPPVTLERRVIRTYRSPLTKSQRLVLEAQKEESAA